MPIIDETTYQEGMLEITDNNFGPEIEEHRIPDTWVLFLGKDIIS